MPVTLLPTTHPANEHGFDVYAVELSRCMSAADVADQIGLSNFGTYELRRAVTQPDGQIHAELHQTSDGDE